MAQNNFVGDCETCKHNCLDDDDHPCEGCNHKIHPNEIHPYNCLCLQDSKDGETCEYYEKRT